MRFVNFLASMIFALLTVAHGALADVPVIPAYCTGANIASVEVPLDFTKPGSATFPYRYQLLKADRPHAPTIIFVPGGPGSVSIQDWNATDDDTRNSFARYGLPAGYNYLFTDPRSIGCNYGNSRRFPDEVLSTQNFARDVVEVIRDLKLTDYYVYGHSYGSQVATVIAGLIEREHVSPPKALILSGVIGRVYRGDGETIAAQVIKQWDRVKAMVPADSLRVLDSPNPLGLDDGTLGNVIMGGLYEQTVLTNGHLEFPLLEQLSRLGSMSSQDEERLKAMIAALDGGAKSAEESRSEERMNVIVNCREIVDVGYAVHYERGEYSLGKKIDCAPWKLDRPYDAKDWPTSRPIFYLSGQYDPATPLFQVRYHLGAERQTDRFFMLASDGGHGKIGDLLSDCKEALWKSFADGGANLAGALTGCTEKVTLSFLPGGQ